MAGPAAPASVDRVQEVFNKLESLGYLQDLRAFEAHPDFPGGVPYMYADSFGYITIGFGHNLSAHGLQDLTDKCTVVRTSRHAFKIAKGTQKKFSTGAAGTALAPARQGKSATKVEIQNDFDFLKDHLGGRSNNYSVPNMRKYTTVELVDKGAAIFAADARAHIKASGDAVGDAFYSFPVSCQAAIVDIDFNVRGGVKSFTKLMAAVKGTKADGVDYSKQLMSKRWEAAAESSNRKPPVSKERNQMIRAWFLKGADEARAGEPKGTGK